jgi:hypothetical protein
MGYQATVKNNVNKAFKLLKDLAVSVTLSSKASTGFDFATNSVVGVTTTSKVIKAIPIDKKRNPSDKLDSTISRSYLFKADDLPDPTIYDTITVVSTSEVWNVVTPYANDGFTVTVNVTK